MSLLFNFSINPAKKKNRGLITLSIGFFLNFWNYLCRESLLRIVNMQKMVYFYFQIYFRFQCIDFLFSKWFNVICFWIQKLYKSPKALMIFLHILLISSYWIKRRHRLSNRLYLSKSWSFAVTVFITFFILIVIIHWDHLHIISIII